MEVVFIPYKPNRSTNKAVLKRKSHPKFVSGNFRKSRARKTLLSSDAQDRLTDLAKINRSLFYLQVAERIMGYSLFACVNVICFAVVLLGHVSGYSNSGKLCLH